MLKLGVFLFGILCNYVFAASAYVDATFPKTPSDSMILTIDVCSSKFDTKLVEGLIEHHIKATFFLTGKFIRGNKSGDELITAHPELFQVANHGDKHVAAVYTEHGPYGLESVKNEAGLYSEIMTVDSLLTSFPNSVKAYRGAGAKYSPLAVQYIKSLGYTPTGFSIAPDMGGTASAYAIRSRLSKLPAGNVVLVHATRPGTGLGEAVLSGLITLQERGVKYSWWSEGLN